MKMRQDNKFSAFSEPIKLKAPEAEFAKAFFPVLRKKDLRKTKR
jgi:hypothetical protein